MVAQCTLGAFFVHFLCLIGIPSVARAGGPRPAEVTLDPLCDPVDSRNPKLAPGNPAPSTRKMAQLVKELFDQVKPESAAFINDRVAAVLENKLMNTTNTGQRFRLEFMLGIEQTKAGRPDKALNTFAALERLIEEDGGAGANRP